MPTPSLLIVPARFKSGKLYSQIPTSGAGDFTVTRATAATRVNASGFIESVASGIPRLDYFASGGTVGCPALLVEPAGTNLARWVNQMTAQDTPAASGGMTITTGSTDFLAPDGTSGSITKYVGGAASGASQAAYYSGGQIFATASGVHTFSLFVKRGATNPLDFCAISFALFTGASGTAIFYFNLASGTAITAGASIQDYGNGWYRLSTAPYTLAAGDLSGQVVFNMAATSGSASFAASGALNLTAYTWGAQFEAGSVATSYIPTTTASITRNADVVTVSGAVSGSIGQTEGTLYAEVDLRTFTLNSRILGISDGTASNRIEFLINTASRIRLLAVQGGVDQVDVSNASNQPIGIYKVAVGYAANNYVYYVNGVQIATDTSASVPATSQVNLGSAFNNTAQFNNRIRAAALYTTRLTNDQLASLTTP